MGSQIYGNFLLVEGESPPLVSCSMCGLVTIFEYSYLFNWALQVKADGSLITDLDLFHHRPYECLLLGYCSNEVSEWWCIAFTVNFSCVWMILTPILIFCCLCHVLFFRWRVPEIYQGLDLWKIIKSSWASQGTIQGSLLLEVNPLLLILSEIELLVFGH